MRRVRFPLLGGALLALLAGLWAGLARAGLIPAPQVLPAAHAPLMVTGFAGTLIALERAVALARPPAFLAPALGVAGTVSLLAGGESAGRAFYAAAAAALAWVCLWICRRQTELFNAVILLGALCLAAGNLLWAAGWPVARVVLWWAAFPILTIAGERLELGRILRPSRADLARFSAIAAAVPAALVLGVGRPGAGTRLAGVASAALAVWLWRHDLARRTLHSSGLPRFSAAALLAAYGWLATGGLLLAAGGHQVAGPLYDAQLHAVFLGFLFSMIFGHAPVIFPAVLGLPVRFHPGFYAHLTLLHAAVAARVLGDVAGLPSAARLGTAGTAAAIALFLGATVWSVVGRRERTPGGSRVTGDR